MFTKDGTIQKKSQKMAKTKIAKTYFNGTENTREMRIKVVLGCRKYLKKKSTNSQVMAEYRTACRGNSRAGLFACLFFCSFSFCFFNLT